MKKIVLLAILGCLTGSEQAHSADVVLNRDSIERGLTGVHDFTPNRILNGDALAKMVLKDPKYFSSRCHRQ